MNAWHATPADLEVYRAGAAEPLLVASLESHLMRCAECRSVLAATRSAEEAAAADQRWATVRAGVDAGTSTPLLHLGVATRPLVAALAVAVLLVVVIPWLAMMAAGEARMPAALLAGAPLAPMVAVVFAYRREIDPAGELAAAAPVGGIRLVARRALLVALTAVPAGVGGALLAGLPGGVAVAWLLPGLALSALVLAAGTTALDPGATATVLAAVWALGIGLVARRDSVERVVDLVAGVPLQTTSLLITVLALALVVARRDRLSYGRLA